MSLSHDGATGERVIRWRSISIANSHPDFWNKSMRNLGASSWTGVGLLMVAMSAFLPHGIQVLTYLRLSGRKTRLLLNLNSVVKLSFGLAREMRRSHIDAGSARRSPRLRAAGGWGKLSQVKAVMQDADGGSGESEGDGRTRGPV